MRSCSWISAAWAWRHEAIGCPRAHPADLLPGPAGRDPDDLALARAARARAERFGGVLLGRLARRDAQHVRGAHVAAGGDVALFRAVLRRARGLVPPRLPRPREPARW